MSVCTNQIAGSVPARSNVSRLVIGYEPLWSIGSGHLPSPAEITAVHRHIRSCLVAHLVTEAREVPILYGGSVNPANTAGILQLPEVGDALVSGASLTAADFQLVFMAVPPQLRSQVQRAGSCGEALFVVVTRSIARTSSLSPKGF